MALLFILINIPFIAIVAFSLIRRSRIKDNSLLMEDENNMDLGSSADKLDKHEIECLYHLNKFDDWLHSQFKQLKNWEMLGYGFFDLINGDCHFRLFLWDGTRKDVLIRVKDKTNYTVVDENEQVANPIEIVNQWMKEHVDFLMIKQETGEGFQFAKSELPTLKEAYDLLLDQMMEQGFISQEEDDLVRFACPI